MNRLIIVIAGIFTAIALVWIGLTYFEAVPVDKDIPPSRQSLANPYLALERSLGSGFNIKHHHGTGTIDWPNSAVLVVNAEDLPDFEVSAADLASWISQGGYLVIACTRPESDEDADDSTNSVSLPDDPLFSDLSPEFTSEDSKKAPANQIVNTSANNDHAFTPDISMDDQVSFPSLSDAWAGSTTSFQTGGKTYGVLRHHGKGLIFVSGRLFALQNQGLKRPENRGFAAGIFGKLSPDGKTVWLPAATRPAGAPAIESLDASPVVLSAAFLCILLFWMAAPRRGPVIPDRVQHRKSLRERFRAEGRFLWRAKAGARMIGIASPPHPLNQAELIHAVSEIVTSKPIGASTHHDH